MKSAKVGCNSFDKIRTSFRIAMVRLALNRSAGRGYSLWRCSNEF